MKNVIENIYDDQFLLSVFKHKRKRGIVCLSWFLDDLARPQKVDFVMARLSEFHICEARIIIQYWEDKKKLIRLFKRYNIEEYEIKREYKKNHATPGYINIHVRNKSLPLDFLKVFLTRHYGNDFERPYSLSVTPYIIIDNGNDEIIAIKLYDDRGAYQYYIKKKH